MTFKDLVEHDMVLYTYDFSQVGLATCVGKTVCSKNVNAINACVATVYSSHTNTFTTSIDTMYADPRATLIAKVASVEDAQLRYPELFI